MEKEIREFVISDIFYVKKVRLFTQLLDAGAVYCGSCEDTSPSAIGKSMCVFKIKMEERFVPIIEDFLNKDTKNPVLWKVKFIPRTR